jgi:hypothetical protein
VGNSLLAKNSKLHKDSDGRTLGIQPTSTRMLAKKSQTMRKEFGFKNKM